MTDNHNRHFELYGKMVIITLRDGLKFIAYYSHFEVQDDYDDNPCFFSYEIQEPNPKDPKFWTDLDILSVSSIELFDKDTMIAIPFEYGKHSRELDGSLAGDLYAKGFPFIEGIAAKPRKQ